MDDQSKKSPFDDFFANKPEGEHDNSSIDKPGVNHVDNRSGNADASDDPSSENSSYYYSYGPSNPSGQEGRYNNSFRQQPEQQQIPARDSNGQTANYSGSVPYEHQTQAPSANAGEPSFQRSADYGAASELEQPIDEVVDTPQPFRQLAPVAAASNVRSGWQMKEKRRTSVKSIFAAFMAGVIVVGGLMYAADQNNWFTNESAAATSSAVQQGTAAAANSDNSDPAVSNAADVVRPNNIAKIFEQASPAVVKIETYVKQQQSSQSGGLFDDPFFRQFFGDDSQGNGQNNGQNNGQSDSQGQLTPLGIGTGFFFDKSGYILTNQHVVGDSDEIEVTVQGYDKPFKAKLLGSSYDLDLAVLKVEGDKAFPTLKLGSSDGINIGDWVVAIGNPYGFDHTVTIGVLSAKERPIDIPDENGTREYKHLLQTDASINPGNSGGPLLNLKGEVVGINTAVSSQAQGIGFAIPTSTIQEVLDNLKNNKEIPKTPTPFIGVELENLNEQYAKQLGIDSTEGVLVKGVYYKSPAYMADVRQYDVIVGVDGTKYATSDKLVAAIQGHKVGDKVVLNVLRDGKNVDLTVTIGDKNQFNTEQ